MLYISTYLLDNETYFERKKRSFLSNLCYKILTFLIPESNPDFEGIFKDVRHWLLEFDDENSYPHREIGLDKDDNVIIIMPHKKNYGYWTDNDLKYRDFKRPTFDATIISKDYFENKWMKFGN